jgi:hypothetical protein
MSVTIPVVVTILISFGTDAEEVADCADGGVGLQPDPKWTAKAQTISQKEIRFRDVIGIQSAGFQANMLIENKVLSNQNNTIGC